MNIEPDSSFNPFVEKSVHSLMDGLNHTLLTKDYDCPHCRRRIRIPITVRSDDIERFNRLVRCLEDFMSENKDIRERCLGELRKLLKELEAEFGSDNPEAEEM
jgi:hypothetical protein